MKRSGLRNARGRRRKNRPTLPVGLTEHRIKNDVLVADRGVIALQVKWSRAGNVRLKGPVGVFLKEFVENETPWAHFDIAGTAYGEGKLPYQRKGAAGFPTRLLVQWVRGRSA